MTINYSKQKEGKSWATINSWTVGGGLLTGMGVGFFFLETSALVFVGCILIGLGVGLLTAAVLSKIGNNGKW
jgi:F0F1-type ATP synthase assembly protein I